MKRFLALIAAGLMITGIATTAFAQNAGPRGQGGPPTIGGMNGRMGGDVRNQVHARVIAGLGLTATQKNAVAAADKKHIAAQDKIRKDFQGKTSEADRKKMRDAMEKARSTYEAELKKALGSKYSSYQTKMQAEMAKEMQKMGAAMMTRMSEAQKAAHSRALAGISLTATQKNSVAAADKKYRDGMAALQKQNMTGKPLTDAQRKKYEASAKALSDARTASFKKAMGDQKYKQYMTKYEAEWKKEMEKLRPRGGQRPGGPPRTPGRA